jgi:excisionase family DNA binding protein
MKKRAEITRLDTTSRVLTLPEVSIYLRVSRVTVYRMLRRKDIPGFRIAGKWRFNIEDLEHWIEKESQARGPKRFRKP